MTRSAKVRKAERVSEDGTVRISAVVCTLNRAAYLAKAVESLVNQTCPKDHYEIIVVDNGSTDNTREVVEQFSQHARIKYVYEPTEGLCQARNTGWQAAGGKYVAYLDDDAIAHPQWLETMLKAFETVKPAPASAGGSVVPIWESERPEWLTDRMLAAYAIVDWGNHARFLRPLDREHHVGCNVAYSREVLQECGGFNVNLGRKGRNLLSNDENLIRRYIDSHALGIYYDPKILVQHLVPKERLTRRFMLRRHFWQGISDVVLWCEESSSAPGRLWFLMSGLEGLAWVGLHLTWFLLWPVLRSPLVVARELATIETMRNYFFRGFDRVSSSLGQSCGYLQIGMGRRGKGTNKGVGLEQGASDTSRPPPKNWNRLTLWSYPYMMLKRTFLGIGGIALLAVVGLYVAGALVEPLRWYLVGIATALLLLGSGLLALSYVRFMLDDFVSHQRRELKATAGSINPDFSVLMNKQFDELEKRVRWKTLKNLYRGQRAFLIGNGPSLNRTPLHLLGNEATLCFNRFDLMFERLGWRPTMYMCIDDRVAENTASQINEIIPLAKFAFFPDIHSKGLDFRQFIEDAHNVFWLALKYERSGVFHDDLPTCNKGGTVAFSGLQVLAFMGCSPIYLVGVDMDYMDHATAVKHDQENWTATRDDDPNHFDPRYFGAGAKYHHPKLENLLPWLQHAKEHLDRKGIRVLNAGIGGSLEVFPRVDFRSLFDVEEDVEAEMLLSAIGLALRRDALQALRGDRVIEVQDDWDEGSALQVTTLQLAERLIPKVIFTHVPYGPLGNRYLFIRREMLSSAATTAARELREQP